MPALKQLFQPELLPRFAPLISTLSTKCETKFRDKRTIEDIKAKEAMTILSTYV